MIRIYTLKTCDSCRKATKFLKEKSIPFKEINIREKPPSKAELLAALESTGNIRKLFNTSGLDYRNLRIKDKLPKLTETHAIALLASNGNLIKRPFLISKDHIFVGFNEAVWSAALT